MPQSKNQNRSERESQTPQKFYAGIGSRETPEPILTEMKRLGTRLANKYTLRSGHAPGADMAFEAGCDEAGGRKEIFIPWKRFNGSDSVFWSPSPSAVEVAELFHPAWYRCNDQAKALHARNVHQIFGIKLNSPVDFVICWTKDGGMTGGTGQALRIASHYNIKIINLYSAPSPLNLGPDSLP